MRLGTLPSRWPDDSQGGRTNDEARFVRFTAGAWVDEPPYGVARLRTLTGTTNTLQAVDCGAIIEAKGTSTVTITIPTDTGVPFALGALACLTQIGGGTSKGAANAGVTLNGIVGGSVDLAGQCLGHTRRAGGERRMSLLLARAGLLSQAAVQLPTSDIGSLVVLDSARRPAGYTLSNANQTALNTSGGSNYTRWTPASRPIFPPDGRRYWEVLCAPSDLSRKAFSRRARYGRS